MQLVYRQYVQALDVGDSPRLPRTRRRDESDSRAESAPAVYAAMVKMTNAAATDVRAIGGKLPLLYASVQADVAWGPPPAAYHGVGDGLPRFSVQCR